MRRTETILPAAGRNGQRRRPSNGRFGASGAVRCWKIGTLFAIVFVVGKIVEAPPAPSRWTLGASGTRQQRKSD